MIVVYFTTQTTEFLALGKARFSIFHYIVENRAVTGSHF